ncbi:hypothetical protein AB1N83_006340, partial [Pleurotus pulmonarius]
LAWEANRYIRARDPTRRRESWGRNIEEPSDTDKFRNGS